MTRRTPEGNIEIYRTERVGQGKWFWTVTILVGVQLALPFTESARL